MGGVLEMGAVRVVSGSGRKVEGKGEGTSTGAEGWSRARGSVRESVNCSRSSSRCPEAWLPATTFQIAASTISKGNWCASRLATSATSAISPHGQTSGKTAAMSEKAGNVLRLTCKETRL